MTLHPETVVYLRKYRDEPMRYGPELKRLVLGNPDSELLAEIAKALSGDER